MPKMVWRNGAPSTRNPPKDAPDWTTDAGMCTKINIVITCMRVMVVVLCECCVCVCYHATCYIHWKQGCWLSLQICNMIAIAGVRGYSYCNTPGNLHYSVLYYRIIYIVGLKFYGLV